MKAKDKAKSKAKGKRSVKVTDLPVKKGEGVKGGKPKMGWD